MDHLCTHNPHSYLLLNKRNPSPTPNYPHTAALSFSYLQIEFIFVLPLSS
jgi:hypothetical protein